MISTGTAAAFQAELARQRFSGRDLARAVGWSERTLRRRLRGTSPLTVDELRAATGQSAGLRPVRFPHGPEVAACDGLVWLDRDAAWCGHCGTAWSGFQLVRLLRESAARDGDCSS